MHLLGNQKGLRSAIRRNWAVFRCRLGGHDAFVYEFRPKCPFVCIPANGTSLQLFTEGYQETIEMDFAHAWLQQGDSAVDVGANVGLMTALFASLVGSTGRVCAVEPSPRTFAHLIWMIDRLGLVGVTPIACSASDSVGIERFFVASGPGALPEEESLRVLESRVGQFDATVCTKVTIDELLPKIPEFGTPALVKIDVEGAEPLVLEGARKILEGDVPPLFIVEVHRRALAAFELAPTAILRYFPGEVFDRYFIPRSVADATSARQHGRLYEFQREADLPIYSNLIAIPKRGRFAKRRLALTSLVAAAR